jgi:hypothetical protein
VKSRSVRTNGTKEHFRRGTILAILYFRRQPVMCKSREPWVLDLISLGGMWFREWRGWERCSHRDVAATARSMVRRPSFVLSATPHRNRHESEWELERHHHFSVAMDARGLLYLFVDSSAYCKDSITGRTVPTCSFRRSLLSSLHHLEASDMY